MYYMNNNICPVCGSALSEGSQSWHFKCKECLYEKGDLEPTINEDVAHKLINEAERESGLREVRVRNFEKLLGHILEAKPQGGDLLDVGCAHGWFIETVLQKFTVLGVEPDEAVFKSTAAKGLPVRNGYFPDILRPDETFDVIVFNDVIEHIPDIKTILESCRARLNDDGLLVLNLPSSDGVFYKLSRLFGQIGKYGFFERLWQKDLPSPHVHYFNSKNLSKLLRDNNFSPIKKGALPTLSLAGLYTRISYTGSLGFLSKAIIYCSIAVALPILRLLPSDIVFITARKT